MWRWTYIFQTYIALWISCDFLVAFVSDSWIEHTQYYYNLLVLHTVPFDGETLPPLLYYGIGLEGSLAIDGFTPTWFHEIGPQDRALLSVCRNKTFQSDPCIK